MNCRCLFSRSLGGVPAAVLCALALVACLEPVYDWKKDGTPPEQIRRDKAICEYDAEVQGGPAGTSPDQKEARKARIKKLISLCMTVKGYRLEQIPIEP